MSHPPPRVRRQYSNEEGVVNLEKDNLKWPAGKRSKSLQMLRFSLIFLVLSPLMLQACELY